MLPRGGSFSAIALIVILVSEPMTFLCIPVSAADAAAVNPNGIKILLANGLSIFFISAKPGFNNGPRSLPQNTPVVLF